jgi:hypothetical protein
VNKRMRVVAAIVALPLLMGADEGCSGGEPLPDQDESCEVIARETNSKGEKYTTIQCQPGNNTQTVLGWHGNCVVGTFWPACKE